MPKPHGRRGRKGERRPPVHRNVNVYRDAETEAKREAAETKPVEVYKDVDMDNTRNELNEAALSVGIVDPDKLPNKQAVLDAIEGASAGS